MNKSIADELVQRSKLDQKMRNDAMNGKTEWDSAVDIENTNYLKKVIKKVGWPTTSVVGQEASQAAWLLVQHADHDPTFQADCLKLMNKLPKGEVSLINIAYLEDRVRVANNKPQLYGTQFYQEGDTFGPRPIEDSENLDNRRKKVGLEPFKDYEAKMQQFRK
jgi:hypothetical protein